MGQKEFEFKVKLLENGEDLLVRGKGTGAGIVPNIENSYL